MGNVIQIKRGVGKPHDGALQPYELGIDKNTGTLYYGKEDQTAAPIAGGGEGGTTTIIGYKPSVKDYGAKGDGVTDDTTAFKNALAANRTVYVPGGKYILSDTILIGDNCELELSQDTVLTFTQTDKHGVEMRRLAHLKGNHATIFVPYAFTKNVIHAATDVDTAGDNNSNVPPFTTWDPQWKYSRYVTDINICKKDSAGFCYSTYGECSGTALYLGCDVNDLPATYYMWGVSMSGIRIQGAFTTGIHIKNIGYPVAWNHDMRIEAVIDSCETGVLAENTNTAHLAVTIQPRRARLKTDGTPNGILYAKWGIKLVNSKGIDLTQSYVWDWHLSIRNGAAPACEYQHIAMYGDCSGAHISDFSLFTSENFWQTIYYDNPASMLTATVSGYKGKIPIDPKYAFYKNYRNGGYDFKKQNLTWRDPHNMLRYDVPVSIVNGNNVPNALYKIGSFVINGTCENVIRDDASTSDKNEYCDDKLSEETITIEENDHYGLIGWSNLYCSGSSVTHRWKPLCYNPQDNIPTYYYTKTTETVPYNEDDPDKGDKTSYTATTFTIYKLVPGWNDLQHPYNCRMSITNARRFMFDFKCVGHFGTGTVGGYAALDQSKYTKINTILPEIGGVDETAVNELIDAKFETIRITTEQTNFITEAKGHYEPVPDFEEFDANYEVDALYYPANNDPNSNPGIIPNSEAAKGGVVIKPLVTTFALGDIIQVRGLDFSKSFGVNSKYYPTVVLSVNGSNNQIVAFNNISGEMSKGNNLSSNGDFEFEWDDNTKTLTLTLTKTSIGSDWTKTKNITYTFSAPLATVNGQKYTVDDIIVTHNDKIEYRQEWVGEPKLFTDEIYIKAEKVYGLNLPTDDHINALIDEKINAIPLASNEEEGF